MKKIFTHSEANEIFKFRCQLKWNELYGKSPSDTERYCRICMQNVYLCDNETELLEHTKQGHCVAIATEISSTERLTYRDKDKKEPYVCDDEYDTTMGLADMSPKSIWYVIEREDGTKAEIFIRYGSYDPWNALPPVSQDEPQGQEVLKKEWHSSNEAFKAILVEEENKAYCINKKYIYQLKELLAWVDEAIAAGLKWRFKMYM